ncbi:MAG: methionine adenosyltransferase domain-containing protein, partial [Clostridia bacterium]|nr:methionine adenosyltransferase domain-containing protein [Clostridia bacterium]
TGAHITFRISFRDIQTYAAGAGHVSWPPLHTKVDRSACYMARYIAKNIVRAGLADRCEVQLAYAIGVAQPVSVMVDTFGTGTVDESVLTDAVYKVFDMTPKGIIETLDLRKPIYRNLAAYGHMGREDLGVRWELCDRVDALKNACL